LSGGAQRSQARLDRIGGWNFGTRFCTFSLSPDGPPLFWQVCLWDEDRQFGVGEQRFATKEDALEFHANLIRIFRTHGDQAFEVLENLLENLYGDNHEGVDEEDSADWWKD
jgi:hypothetical protein